MSSSWCRALHLYDRLVSRESLWAQDESLRTRADRTLAEWRSQSPFQDEKWFQRRLATDSLSEAELLRLLMEPEEALQKRREDSLEWVGQLTSEFAVDSRSPGKKILPTWSPAFVSLVEPLVEVRLERVRTAAQRLAAGLPISFFDPARVTDALYSEAAQWLDLAVSRVLALEIRVAKLRDELTGDTPEERYQSFIQRLQDYQFSMTILEEYPVLTRLLIETLDLWVLASIEFLERLCYDWEFLRLSFFDGKDPGRLVSISGGAGDRHRGGHSVKLLRFASGAGVVYKPRSLAIDNHMSEILTWLSERGAPTLRVPKVLDRGGYGWAELVFHTPCLEREELERFYYRQGAWLALLHVINAHDFHAENIIAVGDHPVLIDLETLFGPELWTSGYHSAAQAEFAGSVMRVMLLPFLYRRGEEKIAFDPSGLGSREGQLSILAEPTWEARSTDEIHLVRKRIKVRASQNRPEMSGERANALVFAGQIVEGFEFMARLLICHRTELLMPGSPLRRCADAEVRVVFRPTQYYALLLRESFHPSVLRDALERDRLFDRLWFGMDRSPWADLLVSLIPSERRDLLRGDIPYFSTRVDARDAWSSTGELLEGLFPASGLEVALARLERLDEEEIARQVWYIRSSLASLAWEPESELPPPYPPAREVRPTGAGDLIKVAAEVGRRLEALARCRKDEASWIGLTPVPGQGWQLRPLRVDLYSGLPGVILFLAYLGDVLGQSWPRQLAEKGFRVLRQQVEDQAPRLKLLGAFSGWGGLLYTWTHLASLWRDSNLLDKAAGFVRYMGAAAEKDEEFDLSLGIAGAIVPLLGYHTASGDRSALELARQLGDLLLRRAVTARNGLGWRTRSQEEFPLTGFSHGTAGCAWALAELFGVTREERYREAALRAVWYENSLFSHEEDNWEDLRHQLRNSRGPRFLAAWCNGATGIGLSRLRILRHHGDPVLLRDVQAGIRTTLRKGFGNNHCLCHGDLGSLELLLEASRDLPETVSKAELDECTARTFASIEENGWICGLPLTVESPGLMEGIAGIGYGLLRLAAPDRVPSVMLLDPPRMDSVIIDDPNRERWLHHGKRLEPGTTVVSEPRT